MSSPSPIQCHLILRLTSKHDPLLCARDALVQETATTPGPAVTVEFVAGVFNRELVVISELLPSVDLSQGKDDNMFPAFHVDDSRVAVGFTGVVDEPRSVAMHRCVHHIKVINTKHVATNSLQNEKVSTIISVWAKENLFFDRILTSKLGLSIRVIKTFSFTIQISCVSDFINTQHRIN